MILMKTDMDGANIAMPKKKKKVKSRLIFCDKEYKKNVRNSFK